MSNIVIPTQDHQVKAFEQPSSSSKKQSSASAEDDSKQKDKNDSQHIVLPTQDHQVKLFEQGGNVSNIVIPNDEQLKAFETENTKLNKKKEGSDDNQFSHTQFTTSVFNLLTSSGNSIFSKYTRQFDDLAKTLDSEKAQLIVLTPTDVAIESLSLKPWQFPDEVNAANDSKDQVSNANIRNFLDSHIIDSSSDFKKIAEGKGVDLKTINGQKLELVNHDDSFKIFINGKEVAKVIDTQVVGNGALLTIDHPLTWPGK